MKQENQLKRVKYLMLFSQLLLLSFMGYWLYSQYRSARIDFQKQLLVEFDESQRKISDSLLVGHLMKHSLPVETEDIHGYEDIDMAKESHGVKVEVKPNSSAIGYFRMQELNLNDSAQIYRKPENDSAGSATIKTRLPGNDVQVINIIYKKLKFFADSNNATLFRNDTALFNKMFSQKMKENGWSFNIKWTEDTSIGGDQKRFYIKSGYFTNSYGIEVSHFSWYLLKQVLPQILFTIVLLLITGLAFRFAYRSLKEQMVLSILKNDFISNMSHELKTPVSTIKVALEALDTYHVIEDKTKTKEYLEMANMEMKRLDLLVNQALNTGLLENGKIMFHKEQEDLQQLTAEVLGILKIRFQQQNAIVNYSYEGDGFTATVDKLHIQGVLINILDNSLKYAGVSPEINVSVKALNGHVQVSIADNGPGISPEYLHKVFEQFFRIPTGNEHNIKGYGLGLSYAKQVMEQHGGSISASNLPGGGCIFTLTFLKDAA
jgi:signal transduction histidine kinase